jgi:hypothetical protein
VRDTTTAGVGTQEVVVQIQDATTNLTAVIVIAIISVIVKMIIAIEDENE